MFKVSNIKDLGLGTIFHLYCPNKSLPNKMMIFKNGTTKDNLQYKDLCKEEHHVRIAYNNFIETFGIDKITNTMIEYPKLTKKYGHMHDLGQISPEYEMLKTFFSKFNIKPTWIYCNQTPGVLNETTGNWTGAVGQVG